MAEAHEETAAGNRRDADPAQPNASQGSMEIESDAARSHARVRADGRVDVSFHHRYNLSRALRMALHHQQLSTETLAPPPPLPQYKDIPRMNIVIQIVGSRGDVQPFIALAQVLIKPPYNHRVRICTHPVFKEFVEESGLEFFSIGGDPKVLMAYMVNNKNLLPGVKTIRGGEITRRRRDVATNLHCAWRSCIEKGDDNTMPFIADAIIANPPSFAHIHCAERLGIPLHLMFTMPWSPTQSFPHPLANVKSSNVDKPISNFLSYSLVELMTWQGLGDIINDFRKSIGLQHISAMWGGGIISRLEVPTTYCWSTALIPKPKDWGPHISISGFFFLGLASDYTPPPELATFLEAGPAPVYIGFGSIVVDDPVAFTELILSAIKLAGVRAVVSKGWGGIGGPSPPKEVLLIDNCPHDWLFPRMSCVVHHGGAGTTAIGVATGKPTVVVPFFGDQPFWGDMIHRGGAGPKPVAYKELTVEILASSIEYALRPETRAAAEAMAAQIQSEDGKTKGAQLFTEALNIDDMRCQICPSLLATWRHTPTGIRLSGLASTVLIKSHCIHQKDVRLISHRDWGVTDLGPRGPATGSIAAVVGALTNILLGLGHISSILVKASAYEFGIHGKHHDHANSGFFEDAHRERDRGSHTNHNHTEGAPLNRVETQLHRVGSQLSRFRSRVLSRQGMELPSPAVDDTENAIPLSDPDRPAIGRRGSTGNTLHRTQTAAEARITRARTHDFKHLYSRRNVSLAFPGQLSHANPLTTIWAERKKRIRLRTEKYRTKEHEFAKDFAMTTGVILVTLLKIPLDLTYNLAVGCHNLPVLLCSDVTVRKPVKITSIATGIVAAGKELTLGFFDGFTGIITQPYRGARDDGVAGFAKGVGTATVGFLFKPGAGIFGIVGYPLKGVDQEFRRRSDRGRWRYVLASRYLMGLKAYDTCPEEERIAIQERWTTLMAKRGKKN